MEHSLSLTIKVAEKRVDKLEGWTIEIIQYEKQRKKIERKWTNIWINLSSLKQKKKETKSEAKNCEEIMTGNF